MKKLAVALLCATLSLGMIACGSGDSDSNKQNNAGNSTGSAITAKTDGYVYEANGTKIAMDAEAEAIITALGDPISYFEAASCAFEGLDKTYTYDGYTVDTYPDEEGIDRINDVVLNDDTVTTPEGARLGMSSADVEEIYGSDYEESNGSYAYAKGGMKLLIVIKDDVVTSIQYISTVLE